MKYWKSAFLIFSTGFLMDCKQSSDQRAQLKSTAIGYKEGIISPDTLLTLEQLLSESKSQNFLGRYLGKRISVAKLRPHGSRALGELDTFNNGCGLQFHFNNEINLFVWINKLPDYEKFRKDLIRAPFDSSNYASEYRVNFDACSDGAVMSCYDPAHRLSQGHTCPFNFDSLVISGKIVAIRIEKTSLDMHLIPTALHD